MTLEDELEEEEESEWSTKQLNHHSEKENHWRDRISRLDEFPVEIQADLMFLGGKQYQRALVREKTEGGKKCSYCLLAYHYRVLSSPKTSPLVIYFQHALL